MASKSDKNKEEDNPVGRPSKYKDEYATLLREYFLTAYEEHEKFPTKAGFAVLLDVSRDTLHEWANGRHEDKDGKKLQLKYPEFSDAYKKIEDYQEKLLVGNCLTQLFNPTFGIFFAKCNLGYKDVQHTDNKNEHIFDFTGSKDSLKGKFGKSEDKQ